MEKGEDVGGQQTSGEEDPVSGNHLLVASQKSLIHGSDSAMMTSSSNDLSTSAQEPQLHQRRPRLSSSPGLSSGLSETSDYQRSTPSPQDSSYHHLAETPANKSSSEEKTHILKVEKEELLSDSQISKEDLGFGDEIKEEEEEEADNLGHANLVGGFSISPSSFYKRNDDLKTEVESNDESTTNTAIQDCQPDPELLNNVPNRKRKTEDEGDMDYDVVVREPLEAAPADEVCRFFVMSAISNSQTHLRDRLTLIRDPKIMRSRVRVALERLPVKDLTTPSMVVSVSEDLFSRVNVSPRRRKKSSTDCSRVGNISSWFARKSKVVPSPAKRAKPASKSLTMGNIIRPAVLTVNRSSSCHARLFPGCQDSAATAKEAAPRPQEAEDVKNNPFLPPVTKSSYLFGFNDDFECVPPGELVITDEDEDDEDEEDAAAASTSKAASVAASVVPATAAAAPDEASNPTTIKYGSNAESDEKPSAIPALKVEMDSESNVKEDNANSANSSSLVVPLPRSEQGDLTVDMTSSSIKTAKESSVDQTKLRFPNVKGSANLIECKWKDCQMKFTTYGKLSDHLKAAHVIGQVCQQQLRRQQQQSSSCAGNSLPNVDVGEKYECLWSGCKVYAKKSCSKSWLEKHVPTHGGKFAFACIVSGCKRRFSSQKLLQRHVNNHFAEQRQRAGASSGANGGANCGRSSSKTSGLSDVLGAKLALLAPKKSTESSESTKNLRRAGVRLRRREVPFSARIFDFFDIGVMAGVREGVSRLEQQPHGERGKVAQGGTVSPHGEVALTISTVRAWRTHKEDGVRMALVSYSPEGIIDDEWIPADKLKKKRTKSVKISRLSEEAKLALKEYLYGAPNRDQILSSSDPAGGGNSTQVSGSAKRKCRGLASYKRLQGSLLCP